jgi:hypothetical protein
VAKNAPRRKTAAGGRIRLDAKGRAHDPATGHFLRPGQVRKRVSDAKRERFTRDATKTLRGAKGAPQPRRAPPPERAPRAKPRGGRARAKIGKPEQRQVPKGLPGGGRFMEGGIRGAVRWRLLELVARGQSRRFVTVTVGTKQWRAHNDEESIMRAVVGSAIANAISTGASVAAGIGSDDISDLVLELEADGWDGLDDWNDYLAAEGEFTIEAE